MRRLTPSPNTRYAVILVALSLSAGPALAHPGHPGHDAVGSFMAGLLHPLTGLDHLLAMITVGLWSALTTRRAWLAPVSFASTLAFGGVLGMTHAITLPAVEPMIAVSLLALGLMLATRMHLPSWAGAGLVGAFALFHGYAHGTELPDSAIALHYLAGFVTATALLHLTGIGAGLAMRERSAWAPRLLGTGVVLYGVSLLVLA